MHMLYELHRNNLIELESPVSFGVFCTLAFVAFNAGIIIAHIY